MNCHPCDRNRPPEIGAPGGTTSGWTCELAGGCGPRSHDSDGLRHEAGWPLHAVSRWLGHTKLTTTDTYLNATTQLLHELNDRKPLALVR